MPSQLDRLLTTLNNTGMQNSNAREYQFLKEQLSVLTNIQATLDKQAGATASGMAAASASGGLVANLPSASIGAILYVTNALAPAMGSTVVGGGAARALVWFNGTNWTVIGI